MTSRHAITSDLKALLDETIALQAELKEIRKARLREKEMLKNLQALLVLLVVCTFASVLLAIWAALRDSP